MIFIKPSTAVIGPDEPIVLPEGVGRVDHEAEVGVVIGATAWRVAERDAPQYVFGLTCVNDVTARELQAKDVQYTRAKGFDTFAPIGPWVETDLDPSSLRVRCLVNGETRQDGNTREMGASVFRLVEFISHIMTLYPGDVIATGTPPGVGSVQVGDVMTIDVEGIGPLTNRVVAPHILGKGDPSS
jgi:2-keto-4-pentenoate hydratase/2-oxohepta-3-ene-1,7-dioic acid hydratase in catechol pathway